MGGTLIFGIPGTSSLGLVDTIRKNPKIRYIVVRHEENAAMAASAYFKLTGKVAGCLTIAGPGGIQEIYQDAFFRPIAVYNNTIYEKNVAILLLNRAMKYALLNRGVGQLSVPNDIQKQPLEAAHCVRETCIGSLDIMPSDASLKAAAETILAAKNPVILAGWGAHESSVEVLALAKAIGAPILTTFRAKGIIPEDNLWVVGILGSVGSPPARSLANDADLLITLGVGFSKFTNVPVDKPMVQVDIDPIRLGKNTRSVPLWGNCRLVLPRLIPLLGNRGGGVPPAPVSAMKKDWDDQRDTETDAAVVPIRPPFIMKVLSEVIPEDAVISLDVGENQRWFGRNFRMKRQRLAMSGYLAPMGFGLPVAIAAKLAYPDRPVFCITGDGGFSMAMADFVTASKYNLPMVVVILNNRQLGMI